MKKIATIFSFSLVLLLMSLSSNVAGEMGLVLNATKSITSEEQLEIQTFVDSSAKSVNSNEAVKSFIDGAK
ncbi:hypothetical protein C1903_00285 [Listeria ivanovii]|uniref:hypothetical protein n=1 Tax=Listeria ivanovii TaxID=1638 RepID=UPI000DA936CA|nr:hypothetical protein [Listeria ivanovii]PZF91327.1 hypothetical protein C1905_00275 [Listeria ivanovii]PZF96835.1 hypothetical protein C1903_00285 [Listeria ivanovii]PZG06918.1 hypothetical protein C2L88_00575 [Listeria ivanovii]PZG11841.1 hypothetical protein C1901_00280 [Listeria ivanovii]PZG28966.1 hypothetical protein C1900_00275 [Listeria ivanovii]